MGRKQPLSIRGKIRRTLTMSSVKVCISFSADRQLMYFNETNALYAL